MLDEDEYDYAGEVAELDDPAGGDGYDDQPGDEDVQLRMVETVSVMFE